MFKSKLQKPLLSNSQKVVQIAYNTQTKSRQEILALLRNGQLKNLNFRDEEFGMTPLHLLTILDDEEGQTLAAHILETFPTADIQHLINIPDKLMKYTPLHHAAYKSRWKLVPILIKYPGVDLTARDIHGNTPLHLAMFGEVKDDKYIKCVREFVNCLETTTGLVNRSNNNFLTPFHIAIACDLSQAVEMMLNVVDISNVPNRLSKQSYLHFICSERVERAALIRAAEMLLDLADDVQLSCFFKQDVNGQTPFHLASKNRMPAILKLLTKVDSDNFDKKDEAGRSALHYVAMSSWHPEGQKCLQILTNYIHVEYPDTFCDIYMCKDSDGYTALQYICKYCPKDSLFSFLAKLPSWQPWLEDDVLMEFLYNEIPIVVEFLMNNAFSYHNKYTHTNEELCCDFGVISGYGNHIKKTKYLKHAIAGWGFETRKIILLHPLVKYYVYGRCRHQRFLICVMTLWQVVWLLSYFRFASSFCTFFENGLPIDIPTLVVITTHTLFSIFDAIRTSAQQRLWLNHFFIFNNILQLVLIMLTTVVVVMTLITNVTNDCQIISNILAIGIVLASVLCMRHTRNIHKSFGLAVDILKQVLIQVVIVLLGCLPILIGFTGAFRLVFRQNISLYQQSNPAEHDFCNDTSNTNCTSLERIMSSTIPLSFLKILVMMTGELEFDEVFDKGSETILWWDMVLYFLFCILISFAFFNQLTGVALDKVRELTDRAEVSTMANLIDIIYNHEDTYNLWERLRGSRCKFPPRYEDIHSNDTVQRVVKVRAVHMQRITPSQRISVFISSLCGTPELQHTVYQEMTKLALLNSQVAQTCSCSGGDYRKGWLLESRPIIVERISSRKGSTEV